MRRWKLGALMISLALLTGCGGAQGENAEDLALQIRTDFLNFSSCGGEISMTAHYPDRVFDCKLDLVYDRTTGGVLTVREPAEVRGIEAKVGKGLTISYDKVSLETGPLTESGISPLEAPVTFYAQITGGYMALCAEDEDALTVTYREGETQGGQGLEAVITFDKESHVPLSGELYQDGTLILSAATQNFQMMTGKPAEGE